ncbi:MAG: hypothetical protein IJ588_01400 [Prevotella sp.]|nr:hypothetical protein [Prevotella sp.]
MDSSDIEEDKNDTSLIIGFTSVSSKFSDKPALKILFFDGTVVEKTGTVIQEGTAGILTINTNESTAKFPFTHKEVELFKYGVRKIRLSTYPIPHIKEFKKDKIGKKIYENYQICSF